MADEPHNTTDAICEVHSLYEGFDAEDPNLSEMSLCLDCAKHPSLKAFVERHAVEGPVCGVCQHISTGYLVCDPAKIDEMVNVIKALVRLYYSEHEYNQHWGADCNTDGLLTQSNPIIEDKSSNGRERSADKTGDFLYNLLAADPYPPEDKGISVYAGFYDGVRLHQFALKDTSSPALQKLCSRIALENHFDIETDLLEVVEKFALRITKTVPKGSRFFRARVGVCKSVADNDFASWDQKILYIPYEGDKLGAPPPSFATAGRLNRAGVAFLYLASDADTATAEVGPHVGQTVSVGEFENSVDLSIASFDCDISLFSSNESELSLMHFVHSVNEIMSYPTPSHQSEAFSITQIIAEGLRKKGFDGVSFKSSVHTGHNLCLFRPEVFSQVAGTAEVVRVKEVLYKTEPCPAMRDGNSS